LIAAENAAKAERLAAENEESAENAKKLTAENAENAEAARVRKPITPLKLFII
jgi:hypothetical protein